MPNEHQGNYQPTSASARLGRLIIVSPPQPRYLKQVLRQLSGSAFSWVFLGFGIQDFLRARGLFQHHGTKLRELAIRQGYLNPNAMTSSFTSSSILNMPQLPSTEIDGLMRAFTLYVRFHKEEWPRIKLAEEATDRGNDIFEEYQRRYREKFFHGTQVETIGDWEEPQEYVVAPKEG